MSKRLSEPKRALILQKLEDSELTAAEFCRRLEIDNNGVENAIRPCALGKKNWLCVSRKEDHDELKAA